MTFENKNKIKMAVRLEVEINSEYIYNGGMTFTKESFLFLLQQSLFCIEIEKV